MLYIVDIWILLQIIYNQYKNKTFTLYLCLFAPKEIYDY
jgi:hypothetical protein